MDWWRRWRHRQEHRRAERRPIPDDLWHSTVSAYPFVAHLGAQDLAELRRLSSLFLDSKEFSGAHGFEVTDEIALAVAVQACLPVLRLGLDKYAGFVGIVMHAGEVVAEREVTDELGVVHRFDEPLVGEAMDGGPMMLSWKDVSAVGQANAGAAYNVVIHEFAHVLDMQDGAVDGVPALPPGLSRNRWLGELMPAYDRFCERVVCGYDTVVDPYGAESPEEFFAVATEAFFVAPDGFKKEQPALHRLFVSYFRQDPAAAQPLPTDTGG